MTMQNLHQADDGEFGMLIGFITPETERAMTVGGPKNCFEDRIAARQQKNSRATGLAFVLFVDG